MSNNAVDDFLAGITPLESEHTKPKAPREIRDSRGRLSGMSETHTSTARQRSAEITEEQYPPE